MDLLLPGMHVAAESPLHHLDPRVKMGATMLLMALPFAAPGWPSTLLLVAFVVVIALLSTAPVPSLLRTLGTVFWLGLFMFFFYLFTTPGQPLVTIWRITVTWEGILAGATQIYRLCLLVVLSALLTFTTSPAQLAHGLEAALGPLARVGLPVRELAMVLTIALRFVPTLFDEIDKIVKAQRARGADLRSRSPWRRIRSWAPTFVPIFVSAFRRADDLARAMEARGFRGARNRTRLHRLQLTWQDLVASLVVLLVSLVIIALERML
ncbi:MAG: energy-coupling factor transporter transmembrane component T [Anaerolineae bacterium]|jgi:energy-coupling factor transport system permease protein